MKIKLLFTLFIALITFKSNAQCDYIPATSTATDTLSYSFSGGAFQSYGCAPIDPSYWMSGTGMTVTVTFVNPEDYPSIRVWGMNDDDIAAINVNGTSYPLTSMSASYDTKVVCGISPGPDGVTFSGGTLTGANSNIDGNYSYQNVTINATNVNSITIIGIAGAGWGFAGTSVNCSSQTGISQLPTNNQVATIYPNPFSASTEIHFTLKEPSTTTIEITDITGRVIKTIAAQFTSGEQTFVWDGVDANEQYVANGMYFIKINTGNGALCGKVLKGN